MAQQNIDFGSFPNDPGADAIRTAFEKVQQNFTDLYTTTISSGVTQVITGPGLGQNRQTGTITISANIPNISIQTSTNLRIGVGVASGNTATISSWATPFVIDLSSNIATANATIGNITVANLNVTNRVTSSLVPSIDVTYNLGSPTRRWKDLYLSGNTIDLGGSLISATGGVVSVPSLTAITAITSPSVIATSVVTPTITIGNLNITNNGYNIIMPALQVGNTVLNPSGLTVSGNVNAGNVSAGFIQGELTTSSQPGITTVGILEGLTVTGDMTTGNMIITGSTTVDGNVSVTGAFSAPTITGNVIIPAGSSLQAPGSTGQITFNDGGNSAAVPGLTFDKTSNLLSISGNVSGGNLVSTGALSLTKDANIGGNVKSANLLTGRVEATSIISSGGSNVVLDPAGTVSAIGNISGGNISTTGTVSANVIGVTTLNASGNATITGNATVGNISTTGTASVGLLSSGNATVTGNISAGNLSSDGFASIGGTITAGNLSTGGFASVGSLLTSGTANVGLLVSTGGANITGTVTAGAISTGNLSAANLTTDGNLTAANVSVGLGTIAAGNINTTGRHTTNELVVSTNANIQGTHRALIGFTTGTHTAGNFFTSGESNVGSHKAGSSITTGLHTASILQIDTNATITGNGSLGNASIVGLLTSLNANITGTHSATTTVTRGTHTANTLTVNTNATITGNSSHGNINVLGLHTTVDANVTGLHKAATSETVGTHTARDLKINADAEITGNSTHGNASVIGTLTTNDANVTGTHSSTTTITRGTHTANTLSINLNASVAGTHTVGTAGANVVMTGGNLTMTGRHTTTNANVTGIHFVGDSSSNVVMTGGNLTMTGRHTTSNANVTGTHYVGNSTAYTSMSAGNLNMTGTHTAGYIVIDNDSETKGKHKALNLQVTNNANFDASMFVTNDANVGSMKVRGDHTVNGNVISDKFSGNTATFGSTPGAAGTSLTVNGVLSLQGNASIGNITAINSVTGGIISLTGNATGTALVAAGLVRVGGKHSVTQEITVGVSVSVSQATAAGGIITLTFADQGIAPFYVGQKIVLKSFVPIGYNLEYTVLTCNTTTVTMAGTNGTITTLGTVESSGNGLVVSGNLVGGSMILAGSHNVSGKITGQNGLDVTSGVANFQGGLKSLDGTFTGKVDINGNTSLYANGDVAGKIFTATLFTGNGSSITNLKGVNIDNSSIDATLKLTNLATAVSTLSVASATSSGNITTVNGLPSGVYTNITGVGTLGSLTLGGAFSSNSTVTATSFSGDGASLSNVVAKSVAAANITGQSGMWKSSLRPGATRLYRSEDNSNYNLQNYWTGTHWFLRGYQGDVDATSTTTIHAEVRVGYADSAGSAGSAGSVPWTGVTGKPTSLSSFTNEPGYLTTQYTPPQAIGTGASVQFSSLGIGTAPVSAGQIHATNNITAYYSDDRLKTKLGNIENALDKIDELSGFYYEENELAESLGYTKHRQVGVSAQQVQTQLPDCDIVVPAPIDNKYWTVHYERLIPLLIEGIKELRAEVKEIKNTLEGKK